MSKKLLKQAVLVVMLVSSIISFSPIVYGKTTSIQQSIDTVKMELKKATISFVEPAMEGKIVPSSSLYPVLNSAMKNYQEIRKTIQSSMLSTAEKQSKLKEIDALYNEKIDKGLIPYIDAYNYATKYLDPIMNDIKIAEDKNDHAAVEKAYHKLSVQLKSRTAILYRFSGKAARDLLLDQYKEPADNKRDELMVPVTIYMKIEEVEKLLNEGKKEEALKVFESIQALMEKLSNVEATSFIGSLIKKVEVVKDMVIVTPDKPITTPPTSSGSNNSDSDNVSDVTPKIITISGTIEEVTSENLVISGNYYRVADSLKGLFQVKNSKALKGSTIIVEIDNGVIQKVTSLNLTNNGIASSPIVIDAAGAVIGGTVTVAGDYYKIQNLTVIRDLVITEAVKNSFETDKLTVNGTVHISDAIARANKRMTVASMTMMAVNPKTRITIVFHDSTVATFEIAKEDIYFEASGSTKVTTLSLQANAEIFANAGVILPRVEIKDGVTRVVLNASIKDVIIDSNDEIEVTGSGNFDNVEINTDKKVSLNSTGTITKLNAKNEESKVSFGESLKVGSVVTSSNKSIEEIISNYDDVKDNIGEIGETTDYFAAGILQIKDRLGYVKLNIKNQGNYQVKYLVIDRKKPQQNLPDIGEQVPQTAIDYIADKEFILWHMQEIYVYKTDATGTIFEIVQPETNWVFPGKWSSNEDELTITTTYNPGNQSPAEFLRAVYYYNGENVKKNTDFSNMPWEMIDGLYTLKLNLGFTSNQNLPDRLYFHTSSGSFSGSFRGYSDESFDLFVLYDLVQDTNIFMQAEFINALSRFAYDVEENTDAAGNPFISHVSLVKVDSVSIATYKAELLKTRFTNASEVKEMVVRVNSNLNTVTTQLQQARHAVENLYKEDRFNYPVNEQLKEGLTQEEINQAKVAVEAVSYNFKERTSLLNDVVYAQVLLNQKLSLSTPWPTVSTSGDSVTISFDQGEPLEAIVSSHTIGGNVATADSVSVTILENTVTLQNTPETNFLDQDIIELKIKVKLEGVEVDKILIIRFDHASSKWITTIWV